MKYLLHVFGYDPNDNITIECADEEDLSDYATSSILDERVEKIIAEKS